MLAGHGDLHHATTGLTGYFQAGNLVLGFLHIGLHFLGLFHQIA